MKKLTFSMILSFVILAGGCKASPSRSSVSEDLKVPDPYIVTLDFSETSVHFKWKTAKDTETAWTNLEYRLYYSTNGNLTNLRLIDETATPYGEWTRNMKEIVVSNLQPGLLYYYNVVARNSRGGRNLYEMKCQPAHLGAVYNEQIPVQPVASGLDKDWWKKAVFYQCFVRMYKDSDGDGKGDFKGLISKLDYLKSLGIGGIWLMPIMESIDNDHGYCVIDYRAVETDYGTMEDFKKLIAEAHKRKIGIILDFVVNHTSSEHPFFQNARTGWMADYRSWYIWEPVYPGTWSIQDAAQDSWIKTGNGYYFSGFWAINADLNFRNPSVRNYMNDTFRYWLNLGIDGYRFDAVAHLIENGPGGYMEQKESHLYFKELRKIADQYPGTFMVCENGAIAYMGNGQDEFNSGFSFGFNYALMQMVNGRFCNELANMVKTWICKAPAGAFYSVFLANHDTFAGQRVFEQLHGDLNKCKVAASVLLTLPGIPFIYYGEEIGMTSLNSYRGDLNLRTPMQWTAGPQAGFTTGTPFRKPNVNYTNFNVETEIADPASLLNHYKKLIAARNSSSALSQGEFLPVRSSYPLAIYSSLRVFQNENVLVAVNFGSRNTNVTVNFTGTPIVGKKFDNVKDLYDAAAACAPLTPDNSTAYPVQMPAYGVRIIRFK